MRDIWDVAVLEHNKLRRKHNVPDLRGDLVLHIEAETYAKHLATKEGLAFKSTAVGDYGTFISGCLKPSQDEEGKASIEDAVRRWISNGNHFNFLHRNIGHMGVGLARSHKENRWIIVCYYGMGEDRKKVFKCRSEKAAPSLLSFL